MRVILVTAAATLIACTLILAFAVQVLRAQSPAGTVTQTNTNAITGTAGSIVCTMTNQTPAPATGIHVLCVNSGATVLTMDAVVPVGPNGFTGTLTLGTNVVGWLVFQATAGASYSYQMSANGTMKTGVF